MKYDVRQDLARAVARVDCLLMRFAEVYGASLNGDEHAALSALQSAISPVEQLLEKCACVLKLE